MNKHIRTICCTIVFLFLCSGTILFLSQFIKSSDIAFLFVDWQEAYHIDENGRKTNVSPEELLDVSEFTPGESYILHAVLENPPDMSYLTFETAGSRISLSVDGQEVYHSDVVLPENSVDVTMADVPIQEFWKNSEIVMTWSPVDVANTSLPMLRITSDSLTQTFAMSYANKVAIPAGSFAIVFLLLCGIFLVGIIFGNSDYSLIALIIAGCILMVKEIVISLGYYFLPETFIEIINWNGFFFLPSIMIILYLILNRKRGYLRYFAKMLAFSLAFLAASYTYSRITNGVLSKLVDDAVSFLFKYGYYDLALYWITAWFVLAGACISAYALLRRVTNIQIENKTMDLRNQALLDNYQRIEERQQQTALLRHEMRHHVLALQAIRKKGTMDQIDEYLEQLSSQTEKLMQADFTKNAILNSILQNSAASAEAAGIHFEADVQVPEMLEIAELDLCSFVMNLLDNALEACRRMDSSAKRYVHFKATLTPQGFLAIQCANSYSGVIAKDAFGKIKTQKEDVLLHGFGLKQMEQIAKKYNSLLEISYTDDTFTVMTALRGRDEICD